jgi:hypothetical protein
MRAAWHESCLANLVAWFRNRTAPVNAGIRLFVVLLTMLIAETVAAAEGPRPPCGNSPLPAYPASAGLPVVQSKTVTNWIPPACLGWDGPAPKLLVAVAGRLHESGGMAALLARFGSVSHQRGVRYWSVTDRAWKTLINDAFAVEDAAGSRRRGDFSTEEMLPGIPLYTAERDSRSSGPAELLFYWCGDERGSDFAGPRADFPICVPVASHAPHAAGAALALKLRHEARAVLCILGDGATSKGDFQEALTFAGVWRLPLVMLINNNQWAISVPCAAQCAAETLAQKSIAAGLPGEQVDGNDVIAVRDRVGAALEPPVPATAQP